MKDWAPRNFLHFRRAPWSHPDDALSPLKPSLLPRLSLALLSLLPLPGRSADGEAAFSEKELAQGYLDTVVLAKPLEAHRATADAAEAREGRRLRRKFDRIGDLRVLELAAGENVPQAIARLRASGRYEYVEPDHLMRPHVVPNDTFYGAQWSLNNTGFNGPPNGLLGADIRAQTAWDNLSSAAGVIVAVIDSGARLSHEDLAANLWTNGSGYHGISAISNNGTITDNIPNDTEVGHGSHVSGILGAVGNNGKGIAGVAWNVQLMELRFLHGATGAGSDSDCIACINYAIANGAKIINASFGSDQYAQSVYDAINNARAAGIIFVASAGNSSRNADLGTSYPAAYPLDNIVTVAATNNTDTLASYSNYGAGTVDLAAPGSNIYSCAIAADSGSTAYVENTGTSMSSPHVSGALALLRAKFPSDTYRQLINRLLRSVTPLGSLAGKVQTGGRLNLAAALASTDNRPFNDDFAARAVLGSNANVRVRASNAGANSSPEAGEPQHAGAAGTASLWWSWTAPASASVTFNTAGSGYDTKLAIYTGTALNALTPVASNDDDTVHGKNTSIVTVNVVANTTYQIAVDCKGGTPGLTLLSIGTVPVNDDFANAQVVTGSSFRLNATTLNAGTETGEPLPVGHAAGHTTWYKWVAPSSAHYSLYAYSSTVDLTTAVYTGSAVGSLTKIGFDDDAADYISSGPHAQAVNANSLVPFNATAGTTYYFQVDTTNVNPTGGDYTLALSDAAWQFGAYGGILSSPAVGANGTIYFGAGTTLIDQTLENGNYPETSVYALNADGTKKWSYDTDEPVDLASPALGADGNVYIGADNKLLALDAATGAFKWSFTATSAIISTPAIAANGTIYLRDDTTLYALTNNGSSFTKKWSFAIGGATYASPAVAADGTVYVGTAETVASGATATLGYFYAINPDGTQKWKFTASGAIYTSPAIANDGTVYFATLAGNVYALNPDGSQKWLYALAGTSITSSPVLAPDGTIYFGAYDHKLHALTPAGSEKWSYTMGDEVRAATPAVGADGTVYLPNYDGLVYAVNASGALVRTYTTIALLRSSPMIANGKLLFGGGDALFYAFNLNAATDLAPANSAWPVFQHNARHDGQYAANTVTITTAPASQAAVAGSTITLTVAATGPGTLSYQWLKNGAVIPGATSASLVLNNAQTTDSGSYNVLVTSSAGVSTYSALATVTIVNASAPPGRLVNLSVRIGAGTGDNSLLVGVVIGGTGTSGTKPVLVRGIGPALVQYGVQNSLVDPSIDFLVQGSLTPIASNDNWGGNSAIIAAANRLGAFALPDPASKDAALYLSPASGIYSVKVTGVNNTTGIALAEIYDASGTDYTLATPRLINVSARAQVGTGDGVLIAGFVIEGASPRTVLIRAVGPTLAGYGVPGAMADPQLELKRTENGVSSVVATNDNWNGDAQIAAAMATVGAFNFQSTGSKDAAILITLQPGIYSAKASGVGNTTGVALVEVYEVP